MNRTEAERLLGGHATGTLSEAERAELYRAALAHQELFDALMDEEALRELLADPEAKRSLLEALAPETAPLQPLRRFRAAPWLGAAAGLLLAAVSLRHWRSEAPAHLEALQKQAQAEAKKDAAPAATPAPAAPPAPKRAEPKPPAPAETQPVPEAAKPAAMERRQADNQASSPAPSPVAGAAAPAARTVEVVGSASAQDKTSVVEVVAEADEKSKKKEEEGRAFRLDAAARTPLQAQAQAAGAAKATADASPAPALTRLPGGRVRLRTAWPEGQWLYALKRRGGSVEVLAPTRRLEGAAEFEFPFASPEVLDLYLLPAPAADPASLPESGRRRRLLPPPEKP